MTEFAGIDLMKFIFSFFVVGIHTHPFENVEEGLLVCYYDVLKACAVPYFFLCTGYFLRIKAGSGGDTLWHAAKKTLRLYLIWSLLYLPLALYDYSVHDRGFLMTAALYIRGLVFVGEHWHSWILWYLLSAFYALVFFGFLAKRQVSVTRMLVYGAAIYTMGRGMDLLVQYHGDMPGIAILLQKGIRYSFGNGRPTTAFLFLPLGAWINEQQPSRMAGIGLACFGFMGGVYFYGQTPSWAWTIVTVTGIFVLSVHASASIKTRPLYLTLRKMSSSIYFLHLWVWTVVGWSLYDKDVAYGGGVFLLTAGVTAALSLLLLYPPVWGKVRRLF